MSSCPQIYTLFLHDALPIWLGEDWDLEIVEMHHRLKADAPSGTALMLGRAGAEGRSEEHTCELQSRLQLVCRLLLEKKKIVCLHASKSSRLHYGSFL